MINSNECLVFIYPKTPEEAKNHSTRHLNDANDKVNPIHCAIIAPTTKTKQKTFRCIHIPPYIKI